MCPKRVDRKALTGKGCHFALRQIQAEIDQTEDRMNELLATTRNASGGTIYLALHHRTATGYTFLRWRARGGSRGHLSWEDAAAIYAKYPAPMSRWYEEIAVEAQRLNERHVALRSEARSILLVIQRSRQPVFARPIPGA